jgi:hypothetical protein
MSVVRDGKSKTEKLRGQKTLDDFVVYFEPLPIFRQLHFVPFSIFSSNVSRPQNARRGFRNEGDAMMEQHEKKFNTCLLGFAETMLFH